MRGVAVMFAGLTMLANAVAADPAHDLFTGQNPAAAAGRIARFACHSCHGRDGRGGIEGNAPEIAGSTLREPTTLRLPYDFTSFMTAVSRGVDPSGRALSRIMPRYNLNKAEIAQLWTYLHDLPQRQRLGVAAGRVRFGVVIDPARPDLGLRYLRRLEAEMTQAFAAGTIYGRRVELVALDDPVGQADSVIAVLAMPPGQQILAARLTALGLPVIFPLSSLAGTEDPSIQRSFTPSERDINRAIAKHLAATPARRIAISADPLRTRALTQMIHLVMPDAKVWSVANPESDIPDAIVAMDGDPGVRISDQTVLYQMSSQVARPPGIAPSFLVIEAPNLINHAIHAELHFLEAHAVLSASILVEALTIAGRDLSRSRLLSVLNFAEFGPEGLDYARWPLTGTVDIQIIAMQAEK